MKISSLCLGLGIFALCSSMAWSKPCEIPVQRMNVAGLKVGQSIGEFQKQHPTVKSVVLGGNNYQLEFSNGVDSRLKQAGVSWVQHIRYDPHSKMITSYSLSFLDGPMASYETDLNLFKTRILKKFKVAQKGWIKQQNKYIYQCHDYRIEIYQDHGIGHTAIGPTVMVFSKNSEFF